MKLKTKVAFLLRKLADRFDPIKTSNSSISTQPIKSNDYQIEEINFDKAHFLIEYQLNPSFDNIVKKYYKVHKIDFGKTYSMLDYHLISRLDDIVRREMAEKIANFLVDNPAFQINKKIFCHMMKYKGRLLILSPNDQ